MNGETTMRGRAPNDPIIPIPDPLGGVGSGEDGAGETPGPVDEGRDPVENAPDAVEEVPDAAEELPDPTEEAADPSEEAAATIHRPPYRAGPSGGDGHTIAKSDPEAGTVTVLEHNTRQAAFVHCIGKGPMATLEVQHPVTEPVSAVKIGYSGAVLTDSVVMNAIVTGSASGWLGHGTALGPKVAPADQSGALEIPLDTTPVPGETVTIQFGLQTHAGCLPYPVLGLPGSRTVESGKAAFPEVSVR
jgi:hypothetical protein